MSSSQEDLLQNSFLPPLLDSCNVSSAGETETNSEHNQTAGQNVKDTLTSTDRNDVDKDFDAGLVSTRSRSNSDINQSNIRVKKINMIIYYGRELLCILALILTTYASFQNAAPKMSRIPSPKPFFTQGSFIHDWPAGILGPTQLRVASSDVSLVMYYAPWCAESQYAREAYENVARLFYRDIHFAAINCWQPGGECRLQYSKVQSWPVLMAYQFNGAQPVQYHGPYTTAALTRFIKSLMDPLKRLTSAEDLLTTMSSHDAVVVAFVDMEKNKTHYRKFYEQTIKWLDRDPYQDVAYGVVTGATAKSFGVEELPTIRIYSWNETLEYSGNSSSWSHDDLNRFVTENVQIISFWISPPGTKTASIAPYLKKESVLFLFTPRNYYAESVDAYNMLRQIGMEYNNCRNDSWVRQSANDYMNDQRHENYDNEVKLREQCKILRQSQYKKQEKLTNYNDEFDRTQSISISLVNVLNSSKHDNKNRNYLMNYCDIGEKNVKRYDKYSLCESSCVIPRHSGASSKMKNSIVETENVESIKYKTSMINSDNDPRSPRNLMELELEKKCNFIDLSDAEASGGGDVGVGTHPLSYFLDDEKESLDLISGLSCKTNKSLILMAFDSNMYYTFAERLGINILNIVNKTAAIIMDHENESTFILKQNVTLNTLSKFIHNYTLGNLKRFKRSNNIPFKFTHYFDINEFEQQNTINNNRDTEKQLKKTRKYVHIKEINSNIFEQFVTKSNKTVVVLFHSSQCAFCTLLSQTLLTVSKILYNLKSNIDFFRIDSDKNDLPWQYTMERVPTLLIFSSESKSESRMFPNKIPVTVPNVLGFIFANLNRTTRLHGIVLACKYSKGSTSTEDCLKVLRREVIDNISYSLQKWRKLKHKRNQILRQLQMYKNMYLHLLYLNSLPHNVVCDYTTLEDDIKYLQTISKNMQ